MIVEKPYFSKYFWLNYSVCMSASFNSRACFISAVDMEFSFSRSWHFYYHCPRQWVMTQSKEDAQIREATGSSEPACRRTPTTSAMPGLRPLPLSTGLLGQPSKRPLWLSSSLPGPLSCPIEILWKRDLIIFFMFSFLKAINSHISWNVIHTVSSEALGVLAKVELLSSVLGLEESQEPALCNSFKGDFYAHKHLDLSKGQLPISALLGGSSIFLVSVFAHAAACEASSLPCLHALGLQNTFALLLPSLGNVTTSRKPLRFLRHVQSPLTQGLLPHILKSCSVNGDFHAFSSLSPAFKSWTRAHI